MTPPSQPFTIVKVTTTRVGTYIVPNATTAKEDALSLHEDTYSTNGTCLELHEEEHAKVLERAATVAEIEAYEEKHDF